jgi:hypothetical protein
MFGENPDIHSPRMSSRFFSLAVCSSRDYMYCFSRPEVLDG